MRFTNHIVNRFLTDSSLIMEMLEASEPDAYKKSIHNDEPDPRAIGLYKLLKPDDSKNYYMTNTVTDKLSMLKIKSLNWTYFRDIKDQKLTFIFPNNRCLRVVFDGETVWFCDLSFRFHQDNKDSGNAYWVMFYINRITGDFAEHYNHPDAVAIRDFIYRLLCFFFLSDNEEIVVQPGKKYGTKKNPLQLYNELNVPVVIVNSKWNITSINNTGFDVGAHFALRWTGEGRKIGRMVFIQPFRKDGYVRKALSETVKP